MPPLIIYKDSSIQVQAIDGFPPVDQSAQVAALVAQVATVTSTLATRTAERDALAVKLAAAQGGPPPPPPPLPPPSGLVQASNLVLLGSFNTPDVTGVFQGQPLHEFSYAEGRIAFNLTNQSLFVVGHTWVQHVAEILIPAYGGTATILQSFRDVLEGKLGLTDPGIQANVDSGILGGLFVRGSKLHIGVYTYYDGSVDAVASHFTRPVNLATTGQVIGPMRVGTQSVAFYGGLFAAVPSAWQAALGGDTLVGNGPMSIIARASHGPSAFAVSAASLEVGTNPTPAQPLVYYDNAHETLGAYGATVVNPRFNGTTQIRGAVIPSGTRSLLFFGSTGLGRYDYGQGTTNQGLNGQPVPGTSGDRYVYDPEVTSKGNHAYPYSGYVWAYDLNDLAAVKAGTKQPWDVVPYATWTFPHRVTGVAYDVATGRIFLSVGGSGSQLTVQVYRVV